METDSEIAEAIEQERQEILGYVDQLREMHVDNKSAVTILNFLKDLISNRENNG